MRRNQLLLFFWHSVHNSVFQFYLDLTCWRLWRDDSWILAGGGATTNARVVWLHAGGADRLLHHLEPKMLAFLLCVTWY